MVRTGDRATEEAFIREIAMLKYATTTLLCHVVRLARRFACRLHDLASCSWSPRGHEELVHLRQRM